VEAFPKPPGHHCQQETCNELRGGEVVHFRHGHLSFSLGFAVPGFAAVLPQHYNTSPQLTSEHSTPCSIYSVVRLTTRWRREPATSSYSNSPDLDWKTRLLPTTSPGVCAADSFPFYICMHVFSFSLTSHLYIFDPPHPVPACVCIAVRYLF
jgi:hypothetical protein